MRPAVVLVLCVALAAGLRAGVVQDGFTLSLDVDLSRVTTNEALYSCGALDVCLRQAGKDKDLRDYDVRCGNYVNFPLPDGSCPVVEATVCRKGGRVGIPLSLFVQTGGTHRVTLHYDTVHFRIFAGDQTDDEMPTAMVCPVVWPSNAVERILSPRVKRADFVTPAKPGVAPKEPDVRPIAGSPQFWTPPAFNAWVGDVAVGVWKGRFHVFYLYDRRHHGSGGGTGRHYFAHLSSADLVHWEEHPLVTPIEQWWECVGTGTPFEYEGKFCLAYGLHTPRVAKGQDLVYAHRDELPKEKRGDGEFTFADLPNAIPVGGTYAETEDGVHFRKTGVYVTGDQNPTVYNRADGRLGLATENGQLFYSTDGKIGHWAKDGEPATAGGDCPAPFSWGDRDYLLQGFYWMASRGPDGKWENWTESGDDIYDGVSVPMVATWKDGRRILVGWLGHTMGWGGWLVFRELVRFPDGKLGTKWLKETPPPGEVRTFQVTDVTKPFVLRAESRSGCEDVELRIDPSEARAQFAFPSCGKESKRMLTAAEILAARSPEKRFAKRNHEGDFAFKSGGYAIGRIRGLDKPFTVRVARYYDAKSEATVFDVEIAGTRTMLAQRWGQFRPMKPVEASTSTTSDVKMQRGEPKRGQTERGQNRKGTDHLTASAESAVFATFRQGNAFLARGPRSDYFASLNRSGACGAVEMGEKGTAKGKCGKRLPYTFCLYPRVSS